MNKLTAAQAIEEINRRAELTLSLVPSSILAEKSQRINGESSLTENIEKNRVEAIQMIEDNGNDYFNFSRAVNQFGYGCALRSVIRKAKKTNTLTPELEKLFLTSIGK